MFYCKQIGSVSLLALHVYSAFIQLFCIQKVVICLQIIFKLQEKVMINYFMRKIQNKIYVCTGLSVWNNSFTIESVADIHPVYIYHQTVEKMRSLLIILVRICELILTFRLTIFDFFSILSLVDSSVVGLYY